MYITVRDADKDCPTHQAKLVSNPVEMIEKENDAPSFQISWWKTLTVFLHAVDILSVKETYITYWGLKMSYLLKVFYSMLYIEEIVKYITRGK